MLRDSGRTARGGTALGALVILLALAACTATPAVTAEPASLGAEQQVRIYPDVSVDENLVYGTRDGGDLLLDACSPADALADSAAGPRQAVLSVHGGSWRQGDKADPKWRSVCEWLASEGFVAFSVNYSLAPTHPFPDGLEDLRSALRWLRQPAQVAKYRIDPEHIGAFGGSAGGNLVSLLGVEGSGAVTSGTRVAAVVELSGPIDLTEGGLALGTLTSNFVRNQFEYLDCKSYAACPTAEAASPVYQVDASDPPFFIATARDDFIPMGQSQAMADALREAGVEVTFAAIDGKAHSIALLDERLRARIVAFLREHLAP